MRLKDKVAVVVGGGSGIGKAISKLFAQEGAQVMLADIDIEAANRVADEIKAVGGVAATVKVDMTQDKEAQSMARTTLDRFGRVDILANVAGGSTGKFIREKLSPFHRSTKEEWDRIIDVNLTGARNCTRAFVNHMMERGKGRIINFSSMAGVEGMQNGVDYSAAKAGIVGLTKGLALELASYGIRVNCISPAGVATERVKAFNVKRRELNPDEPPLDKLLAKPEELAAVALFLASDEVDHISGETIVVNGQRFPSFPQPHAP